MLALNINQQRGEGWDELLGFCFSEFLQSCQTKRLLPSDSLGKVIS